MGETKPPKRNMHEVVYRLGYGITQGKGAKKEGGQGERTVLGALITVGEFLNEHPGKLLAEATRLDALMRKK